MKLTDSLRKGGSKREIVWFCLQLCKNNSFEMLQVYSDFDTSLMHKVERASKLGSMHTA